MKKTERTLTRNQWATLILGLALFLGLLIRLFPGLLARFPLNDGGMFLGMIRDLRANGFLLPTFTTYNLANIPFAYPPFGFYVAALLSLLGIPELETLRWMPALVNFVSIPAFYLLANALLKDRPHAAVAAVIFALVPSSYGWQIMGGGLTRSFGILFIILALYAVYRMFERDAWTFVLLSMLFGALAVLSHPEAGLATASACAFFWLAFGRTKRGILQAVLVALGVAVLTAPWWSSVLSMHGLSPFLSVLHSGQYNVNPLQKLIHDLVRLDGYITLFYALMWIGVLWNLYKHQFFLPIWLALHFFVEPRSAEAFAFLPACILTAQTLVDVLPTLVDRLRRPVNVTEFTQRNGWTLSLLVLMLFWFVQSGLYDFALVNTSLVPPAPQAMMDWVRENTPADARFLVLTGQSSVMIDPLQEWFPALAERHSLATQQGYEWTLGVDFFPRLDQFSALQKCRDVMCIQVSAEESGLVFDYLLVEKNEETRPLLASLAVLDFVIIHQNGKYFIYPWQK